MTVERFEEVLDELDGNSLETLKTKNRMYSTNDNPLHNFESGAQIAGGTAAQACWGYMTKHLTALRDKVMRSDFSDKADLLEKCQDIINYVRFIYCIGVDQIDHRVEAADNVNCEVWANGVLQRVIVNENK